ncbi:nucleotidyltransferase domain-containing protein [Clostridium sp. NSJ-145]|uniref:nucleotidyltransferase domain-containing protein n=1 Tax=Clostridium sp. NSJ-145 TaxID=2897777 RepID=UPI001E4855F8|nr:nucleotidyltransferase domain-containing protein [Clostridium sp. NSJ-145]MCD2502330.1 nucleotidyltransferase domain-containing protein [Clostridium sp. NSJ-145]
MNLDKAILEEIVEISKKHSEINKVILFGSRARKDNGDRSDIDLAIYSEASISEFIEDIENNTTTLLEFDFSDMKSVSDELFINQVNKEGIIIYEKY